MASYFSQEICELIMFPARLEITKGRADCFLRESTLKSEFDSHNPTKVADGQSCYRISMRFVKVTEGIEASNKLQ